MDIRPAEINDDRDRERRVFRKMLSFTAFLSFPALFGMALVAKEFILVTITDTWIDSVPLLQTLCIGGAFLSFYTLYQHLIIASGRSDIYLWCNIGQIVIQIALILLFHSYGINTMVAIYTAFTILWLTVWQFLLYQTPDGDSQIEVKLQNDTVWLSLDQMAELFQRNKSTISRHIKNVLEDGELEEKSVVAFFATTASDSKTYSVAYYNLDMIISVGYRVHSYRGVQFRIWATKVLKEYIVKGFAMNDDLLKRAGEGNYFDELLARIRDIRSSEKVFYRKVLEIYAHPHSCR